MQYTGVILHLKRSLNIIVYIDIPLWAVSGNAVHARDDYANRNKDILLVHNHPEIEDKRHSKLNIVVHKRGTNNFVKKYKL